MCTLVKYQSTQFKCETVPFDSYLGANQILPLRLRVDRGAMAMKRYYAFPKAPALLEPPHQIVYFHIKGGPYPSEEMESAFNFVAVLIVSCLLLDKRKCH